MRARRIENEWKLLGELEQLNPTIIRSLRRGAGPNGDVFELLIDRTPAPIRAPTGIAWVESHLVLFTFPLFFPTLPIEASLANPVFHPNVDPENGFVCLWTRTCPGDTMVDAITRLRDVISWKLVNDSADHIMQPDAIVWRHGAGLKMELPRKFDEILVPERFGHMKRPPLSAAPHKRRRLFEPV